MWVMKIVFVEGSFKFYLVIWIMVLIGYVNWIVGFKNEMIFVFDIVVCQLIGDCFWDDNVIVMMIWKIVKYGFDDFLFGLYKDYFVSCIVVVEFFLLGIWLCVRGNKIVIK